MSKQQRTSGKTGDGNNISSKLLGTKVSDIKIEKFRDLTNYQKDKYQLTGKFSIPILKTITNKFSPQVMFTIVLPNQAISSIDALSECDNLMILNLSHNSIESVAPLKNCKQLKIINFADNSIPNLNSLSGCKDLVNVHAEGNMIKGIDQIQSLKECPSLKNVHLQTLSGDFQNPICSLNDYRDNVLEFLDQIKRLDSIPKGVELHNGSQLKLGKKKQMKIQLKSIGPFYTSKFPSNPPYTVPTFPGEQPLKKAIGSCKTAISNLQIRMKAALAL